MNEPLFKAIGVSRLRMLNDGEGVTTLAAAFGCPLRCRYCLNPQCFLRKKPWKEYTVRQLIDEVSIDDLYFQATGGGVVFGGGEPLLYPDFIHEFRRQSPKEWKIGLETSLSVPLHNLKTVISDIDYFLIDTKDMNPDIYRKYTGKSIQDLTDNLEYLIRNADRAKATLRVPLIEGYNTENDQKNSMNRLKNMGFSKFDLFRYDTVHPEEKRKELRKNPLYTG